MIDEVPLSLMQSGLNHLLRKFDFRKIRVMKAKDLQKMGVPYGKPTELAQAFMARFRLKGGEISALRGEIQAVLDAPVDFLNDPLRGAFAKALTEVPVFEPCEPAPWKLWGKDLEPESVKQMERACQLPISVQGALMPDAHLGYGLPIGGVLGTEGAVIPYAVGVDIACRMKLSVVDLPVKDLDRKKDRLAGAINAETRFGIGASFKQKRAHDVMDADWDVSPVTHRLKDKAWSQLGTSGSGNHFVEFGTFELKEKVKGLAPGTYMALLSHSGSRGTGAQVCDTYSKLAMKAHPELPRELKHLAWLDLDSEEGVEYWNAMELMGQYAAANHACIHRHVLEYLGVECLLDIENHHNFAWKETHEIDGQARELIVHRKGATPAGKGVLGFIPGSMASPGFLVRGKGSAESLNSASHGAGRVMSRTKAMRSFEWAPVKKFLKEKQVTLMSAGLDEVPMVYKDIHQVMGAQSDLVEILGQFDPRIVKMAPHGERPED
jgi:tRNA-splicing ligase RtcB